MMKSAAWFDVLLPNKPWRPGKLRWMMQDMAGIARQPEHDNRTHLRGAIDWLCRAQDVRKHKHDADSMAAGWSFEDGWLHGGLSPEYRGADCTFWALHNGEPEKIGCTLHYIDDGRLVAHISPEVREGELDLFWRVVRDSAEVYAEAIERLAQGEQLGRVQPGKGRLYQVRDRGLRQERTMNAKLASGMLAGMALPRRVQWFVAETVLEQNT